MRLKTHFVLLILLAVLGGPGLLSAQPFSRDVGCSEILVPGDVIDSGIPITPICHVRNYGTQECTIIPVRMKFARGAIIEYSRSETALFVPPGAQVRVTFPEWIPDLPPGEITVSCSTELAGDENPINDKLSRVSVIQRPDTGRISGTVFRDDNGNGEQDPDEPGLQNWTIKLTPGPKFVMSDQQGNYVFDHLAANTYTISEYVKTYWEQTSPAPPGTHTVALGPGETVTGKDFGNRTIPAQDLAVSVVGTRARPGFEKTLSLRYENQGTIDQNATLRLILPPSDQATYLSSTHGGVHLPAEHAVIWNLGLLPVGEIGFPQVTIMVNAPMGTWLASSAVIEPIAGDMTPEDNVAADTEEVRNSWDPNEKLVLPQDFIDRNATIEYTILFQNVGNDTAYNIVVRDTLDPNLDISTIELGAATHPYVFGIGDDRELIWTFAHIMLPDSGANQLASNGALKFRVHTLPNLPVGTHVDNTAAIYFDFNEPVVTNTVRVTVREPAPRDSGWVRLADVPAGPKGKNVKDGGCLAALDSTSIYAFKGNNTCEFYGYNPVKDTWFMSDTIPCWEPSGKKRCVRKGATLVAAGPSLYFTKGKGSNSFWRCDFSVDKPSVWLKVPPPGRYGVDDAVSVHSDTDYVYFLEQGGECTFARYNTLADTWKIMAAAPLGISGKTFKDGSALASDGSSTIYALKGSTNEFYAYDVAGNTWRTLTSLPLLNRDGKKKKAKAGAALAYLDGYVYAQKGNNTREVWRYDPLSNTWTQTEDMPLGGGKNVKGGGAMTAIAGRLYSFKGNNTREFYRYTPSAEIQNLNVQTNQTDYQLSSPQLRIAPNPFTTRATVAYSLPTAGQVSLKLYDVTGKLVTTLASGYHHAGSYRLQVTGNKLASGIYLLKLETQDAAATAKLIIE